MPYLLNDKQCIQQITKPRMSKKTQAGIILGWVINREDPSLVTVNLVPFVSVSLNL